MNNPLQKQTRGWEKEKKKEKKKIKIHKRDSAAFLCVGVFTLQSGRKDGEKERETMQISRSQVSLCLSVYPLM